MFSSLWGWATSGAAGMLLLGFFGFIRPLQYYARLSTYFFLMMCCALYGTVVSALLTLVGKQGLSQWATGRAFYHTCRVLMGLNTEFIHPERLNTRPAVFISNHQSEMDIYILGALFPKYCSVTAKRSLKYYPFLGWFMNLSASVFIDRGNRKNALMAFESAKMVVKNNKQSVFMFPEGTRSYTSDITMLPFKKGAFHFAIQCQIPVVPIVVANYSTIWDQKKKHIENGGSIPIEILEPIPTKGLTSEDVDELLTKTRKAMEASQKVLGYATPNSAHK